MEPKRELRRRTLEFGWGNNLDIHDGLKDDTPGLLEGFTEGTNGSKPEGQFGGIDSVEGTVPEHESNTTNWVARKRTLFQSLVKALDSQTPSVK